MLALAFVVAFGGLLTIGFAYWAMNKAVPAAAKDAAKVALEHVEHASATAAVTNEQYQDAVRKVIASPEDAAAHTALEAAATAQPQAAKNLSEAAGVVKELLGGLGSVFKELGALSPPIAALCVAVLMFLTAGGIAAAEQLIE
jgi:hypothetical protein